MRTTMEADELEAGDPGVVVSRSEGVPVGSRSECELPTWFVVGFAALVVWFMTTGVVAVLLLYVDWYSPGLALAVATLAAAGVGWLTFRRLGGRREHAAHGAALVAVGLAVAFLIFTAAFHSEHLLTDRDPAVYINTGRAIARSHELHPVVRSGPFADKNVYTVKAAGFTAGPDGRLQWIFFPMLPAMLAVAWSIGGDSAMLVLPALLGALGLLACYALTARLLGARLALIAPALLMLGPLQLWFARDAYSELVVQVALLAGLWLFLEARVRGTPAVAIVAGVLFGSAVFARIDVLAIIAAVFGFVALAWVRADGEPHPAQARRVVAAFAAALVVTTAIGLHVTNIIARAYIRSLGNEYRQVHAAFIAAVLAFVAVVIVHRVRPGIGHWVATRRWVPISATVLASGAFVWAYWVRPEPTRDLPVPAPHSQVTTAIRAAITNWHWSRSLQWFGSYLGVIAVIVAFVGFVILGWRALRGNDAAAAIALVVLPIATLYIVRPSISIDQPWAMRRYLPVVIPGIAIAIAVVLAAAWTAAIRVRPHAARVVAIVGVAVLVGLVAVPSAMALRPFVHARYQQGALAAVHAVCHTVGDDGAVLVYGYRYLDIEMPQTVRGFCGVPAAKPVAYPAPDLPRLARDWKTAGRRLFVVTGQPEDVLKLAPGSRVVLHTKVPDRFEPQGTADRRPTRFGPRSRDISVIEIPPSAA